MENNTLEINAVGKNDIGNNDVGNSDLGSIDDELVELREGVRSQSISSLTDSLDADDQSVKQPETENCKPKKPVSRLPVKTKPSSFEHGENDRGVASPLLYLNNTACDETKELKISKLFHRDCFTADCNSSGAQNVAKETLLSRLTIDKVHCHGNEADYDEYLTPTQRKGMTIRDLKKQVKDLEGQVDDKDCQIESLKKRLDQEVDLRITQVKDLGDKLISLDVKYGEITQSYEESVKEVDVLETKLFEMKEREVEKDLYHKNMYLEMYEKGKESARFEREDELEMLVKSGKGKVSLDEVYKKLTQSQADLAKWQSLRRMEMYEVAETPKTEAESRLKFLKDSFFHFLTNENDSDDCLRAMVAIFNFSDVQKKKIIKMLIWKKKS